MNRTITLLIALLIAAGCVTTRRQPETPRPGDRMSGLASWYGQEYAGRTTANGEIFDPMVLTAAHRTLPFGTLVRVESPGNGKSVDVRINDRGPFIAGRLIDLSYAAARELDLVRAGVGPVDLTLLRVGAEEPLATRIASTGPPETGSPLATIPTEERPVPAPSWPDESDDLFGVEVVEERGGRPVRKQVGPDGRSIEIVPATPSAAGSPPPTARAPASRRPAPQAAEPRHSLRWAVQLGAFLQEENATSLQRQVATLISGSYIERSGGLHRVRVGPFASKSAAIDVRERLESAGMSGLVVEVTGE
ncbi:MAG TPA: septal ring lytic transglycosylase RlpA family protein [Thermoanaerobaculia bacterium]|nr:septal ring lytic transglycosylase RlpA family protein [Thermoanaerobaculia bacterium]